MLKKKLMLAAGLVFALAACSDDEPKVIPADSTEVSNAGDPGKLYGFYVLNEGNMGSNKCTIDYFDYTTSRYVRNLYPQANPGAVLELGDMGNDIAVHGARLYIVVNGSNKVEVVDVASAKRIGQIDVPSPRYITFDDTYGYISSYSNPQQTSAGSVVRFRLDTLEKDATIIVGLGPEEMVVADGYLYIANSASYSAGLYDDEISVVRLSDFKWQPVMKGEINMHHLRKDSKGNLWFNSRGNYADKPYRLFRMERKGVNEYGAPEAVADAIVSNFAIGKDRIYYYGVTYDANWNATNSYGMVDLETAKVIPGSFITDGSEKDIMNPYCIAVQPYNDDILITDARNYVTSGDVRCYTPDGTLRWEVQAGDIPGHIAFVEKR